MIRPSFGFESDRRATLCDTHKRVRVEFPSVLFFFLPFFWSLVSCSSNGGMPSLLSLCTGVVVGVADSVVVVFAKVVFVRVFFLVIALVAPLLARS